MDARVVAVWDKFLKMGKCPTGKLYGRLARRQVHHPNVPPINTRPYAGTQRLGAGLFGRKSLGIRGRGLHAHVRFLTLDFSKNPVAKALTKPLKYLLHAPDINQIIAKTNNHQMTPLSHTSFGPRFVHCRAHPLDRSLQPEDNRLADDEVADIEFAHLRQNSHCGHGVIGQAMPGVNF